MKFKYIIFIVIIAPFFLISCEEEIDAVFDVENGESFANFVVGQEFPEVIFNPTAQTENIITIGVSTLSNTDRAVQLTLDAADTTLDPSVFSISTLSPVIPAGAFTTDIVITIFGSPDLPDTSSVIALTLDSVEGAEIKDTSVSSLNIGIAIECPSVDIENVIGTGDVVTNELLTDGFGAPLSAGGLTRSVIEGPGENQITILTGVGFNGSEDLVLNIDPDTGIVSYGGESGVTFFINGGTPIPYTEVSGIILTCIGLIDIEIAAPFASPFNQNTFSIQF